MFLLSPIWYHYSTKILSNIWGLRIKSWILFFPLHLNDETTKWECAPAIMALVVRGHFSRGSEFYCYNTEGDRNSVVSQAPCWIDVIRLEHINIHTWWSQRYSMSSTSLAAYCGRFGGLLWRSLRTSAIFFLDYLYVS